MLETPQVTRPVEVDDKANNPTSEPCVMLVFGASGDLTKRLLVPALYNLECDNLLSDNFALLGTALDRLTTEQFRAKMDEDIQRFHTRNEFDRAKWNKLLGRFHYMPSTFDDLAAFSALKDTIAELN